MESPTALWAARLTNKHLLKKSCKLRGQTKSPGATSVARLTPTNTITVVASITARDRFYILSRACALLGGSKHQICRCQVSHSHQFDHDRIFDINRLYSGEIAIAIDDLEIQR